jgi:hypothetical protein
MGARHDVFMAVQLCSVEGPRRRLMCNPDLPESQFFNDAPAWSISVEMAGRDRLRAKMAKSITNGRAGRFCRHTLRVEGPSRIPSHRPQAH